MSKAIETLKRTIETIRGIETLSSDYPLELTLLVNALEANTFNLQDLVCSSDRPTQSLNLMSLLVRLSAEHGAKLSDKNISTFCQKFTQLIFQALTVNISLGYLEEKLRTESKHPSKPKSANANPGLGQPKNTWLC